MMYGVKCSKCGLIQLPKSTCKACGAQLEALPQNPAPRATRPSNREALSPTQKASVNPNKLVHHQVKKGNTSPFSFHGDGGSLFGIWIVNMFLSILTLGIYYFWGKMKIRKYLFSQTEFDGDRFAYHGTGKELFIGSLKALVFFFIPLFLLNQIPTFMGGRPVIYTMVTLLTYAIIVVFIPVAMVGVRRYRLSRSSWRGIRFSFRGETWDFIKLFLWGSFLTAITLGIYNPFFETKRYDFMVSNSYFGNREFEFDGNGRELLGTYLLALLLTLPTLGFYWFWYLAKKQRFFWEHTSFGSMRFRSSVTGRALLNLYTSNWFIVILTLGLAWPWVMVRNLRFVCDHLSQEGTLDLVTVEQEAQTASATGEALAGFMDAGFDFGTG